MLHYHKLATEIARITPILELCEEIKVRFRTESQNASCAIHKPDEELAKFILALPKKFEPNKISLLANALKEDKPYDLGRFCRSLDVRPNLFFKSAVVVLFEDFESQNQALEALVRLFGKCSQLLLFGMRCKIASMP